MSKKLNLTPQDLNFILNTIDRMKNSIVESSNVLQRDTIAIKNKWNDDQFESFQSRIILYNKQLKQIADQLDIEKQRIQDYQRGTAAAADKF
jgi:hypothetical protein